MTTSTPTHTPTESAVQEAFEAHERAIRVPDAQNDEAKGLHPPLREEVTGRPGLRYEDSFLNGSYRRKTQIAPLGDLDVVIVLGPVRGRMPLESPAHALERIAEAALACKAVRRIEPIGVRAVTCVLWDSDITVDLVPALEHVDGDRLWLCRHKPAEGLMDWTLEHPRGQIRAASATNEACGGTYIPLVRVAKGWNCRVGPGDDKLLPSYAMEAATCRALGGRPADFAPGLAGAYAVLEERLARRLALPDPGNPDRDVLELLDEDRRQRAIPVVQRAAREASRALSLTLEGALSVWGELLGPTFPGPEQRTGRMAAGLVAGTVGGLGSGIAVSEAARAIAKAPRAWRPW